MGDDSQHYAAELAKIIGQSARGEHAPLRQRLTHFGSALAQEGVEYARLHTLATQLRKELRAICPGDPELQLEASDAIDAALGIAGESYVSEREGRVRAERNSVVQVLAWKDAVTTWISSLNEEKFAGHDDWRLPSLEELRTLLAAVPPCDTQPCPTTAWPRELTAPAGYWSSTTFSLDRQRAWAVSFRDGDVYSAEKVGALHVRAVRSGS